MYLKNVKYLLFFENDIFCTNFYCGDGKEIFNLNSHFYVILHHILFLFLASKDCSKTKQQETFRYFPTIGK